MGGHEARLAAFALYLQMGHSPALLAVVSHFQLSKFFPAQAMIEQGRENGAVALAFERIRVRSAQQGARLGIAQCRGFSLLRLHYRALHAFNQIVGHCIGFT